MIIEEIKKANVQAIKERDTTARAIYSIIINKYLLASVEARTTGNELEDAEVVKLIQKTINELEEECENYKKVGNTAEVENISAQKQLLSKYLPQMLSEDEILKIIMSLEDKTVPSVMRHFKTNYGGKCDMRIVSALLKNI